MFLPETNTVLDEMRKQKQIDDDYIDWDLSPHFLVIPNRDKTFAGYPPSDLLRFLHKDFQVKDPRALKDLDEYENKDRVMQYIG